MFYSIKHFFNKMLFNFKIILDLVSGTLKLHIIRDFLPHTGFEPAFLACEVKVESKITFGISAGIFKQSMGDMNRVGIRLSYRPARLCGSLKVLKFGLRLRA
jgi:hypothetical protein